MSRTPAILLSMALLAAGPALAQTQQPSMTNGSAQPSISGPAPNMGSPMQQMTNNQQPANVRRVAPPGGAPRTGDTAGATKPQGPISGNTASAGQASGQQMSQPTPNQFLSQTQQAQDQQPANVRNVAPSGSTPTNDPSGATKPQGPVTAPASRAQANRPATGQTR